MEKVPTVDLSSWEPKTRIGWEVKKGNITDIDQIIFSGKKILEPEIVDSLLKDLYYEVLTIYPTQRMTDSGRRTKFRTIVVLGNLNGYVGIGVGKQAEVAASISEAVRNAKKNIIKVPRGCGSWECKCGGTHSIPATTVGHHGSVRVVLKPAPKGVGLVANETAKIVLTLAGIKDVWTFSRGKTATVGNTAYAVYDALKNLLEIRRMGSWASMQ